MSNDLVIVSELCELDKTKLTFKRDVMVEEWKVIFGSLKKIEGCVQFWIGDALAYRSQKWGMYDDVIEETGYDKSTLQDYKRVAENVKSPLRNGDLQYAHHREVASLPPEKQTESKELEKFEDAKNFLIEVRTFKIKTLKQCKKLKVSDLKNKYDYKIKEEKKILKYLKSIEETN